MLSKLKTAAGLTTAAFILAACQTASVEQDTVGPAAEAAPADTAVAVEADDGLNVTVHDGDFVRIQQFTTPGGISVWLVEEPSIPIMAVRMAWQTGAATDPAGMEGLTDGLTYMMNEGAGDLGSLAFATRMEELNMGFSCGGGDETTYCSANMLTDNADEAMDLVSLALTQPRFDAEPFDRFKREQLIGIKTRETNAGYLAGRARNQALMPDHPFSRIKTEASINTLTTDLLRERMADVMTGDRLYVTAVGAMSPEELAPLLDDALSGLPEASSVEGVEDVALKAPLADPVVVDLPQPQSLVSFAAPGIARDDDDFYAAYVLNYTFGGGGFESRLMKDLRVEKGLTYGIYTGLDTSDHLNLWTGGGQTKNESAAEFIDGIKSQMNEMVANGVTEQELSDAKAYLTGSYPLAFDSNSKIASNLMSVRLEDLGVDYFDRRNSMIEAVTMDDVSRIAAEYLQPQNFTFVVVGEPQGIEQRATLPAPMGGDVDIDEAGDMREADSDETTDATRDQSS
jgi:zinc protease